MAELEDEVAQTGALLRLLQDEARYLKEMTEATQSELVRWENGESTSARQRRPRDLGRARAEDIIDVLDDLHDSDRDREAEDLLVEVLQECVPDQIAELGLVLQRQGRRHDLSCLLNAAARTCDGPYLRRLLIAQPEEKQHTPGRSRVTAAVQRAMSPPLRLVLMPVVARQAPAPVVARLAQALRQRGEDNLLRDLGYQAAERSDVQELRKAGVPAYRWSVGNARLGLNKIVHLSDCKLLDGRYTGPDMDRDAARTEASKVGRRWCDACDAYVRTQDV